MAGAADDSTINIVASVSTSISISVGGGSDAVAVQCAHRVGHPHRSLGKPRRQPPASPSRQILDNTRLRARRKVPVAPAAIAMTYRARDQKALASATSQRRRRGNAAKTGRKERGRGLRYNDGGKW